VLLLLPITACHVTLQTWPAGSAFGHLADHLV